MMVRVRGSTLSVSASALLACLPVALAFSPSFPYGTEKVRGVSLGGWLVLESWITPSLFDDAGNTGIVDEWTFGALQDGSTAQQALIAHWDSWITEADFAAIAAANLNHVRVPIGYWAWEVGPGEPYIQGQLAYLRKAVDWASAYGLKLIIDLHGVPGSQNGFDNSGHRISQPQWQSNQTNIHRTNSILKRIASEFGPQYQTVAAITPINEASSPNTLELIHDAFEPLDHWNGWQQPPKYQGVAMDTHIYHMFSNTRASWTRSQHISYACGQGGNLQNFNDQLFTIVGEWTPAVTDCATYLNGRGVGARYDGTHVGSLRVGSCAGLTGSGASFSPSYKTFLRQSWEAQVTAYEKASGWIMWTWKTERADEWSYQAGLRYGWIPANSTARQFPGICG
ncbi:exo-beta-1,3-glucanase [Russula earlei]|uniref:Exo-beta-1,3-glucanase n=1 Tax=Russula earlei TaxID=71964 RepID=A0ACC0UL89_9AGAM|nr:exo-beta-1,3-glucanase [Russula earlei]